MIIQCLSHGGNNGTHISKLVQTKRFSLESKRRESVTLGTLPVYRNERADGASQTTRRTSLQQLVRGQRPGVAPQSVNRPILMEQLDGVHQADAGRYRV